MANRLQGNAYCFLLDGIDLMLFYCLQFAHLPLLLNTDRSKLSKRQGDVDVSQYKVQQLRGRGGAGAHPTSCPWPCRLLLPLCVYWL